MRKLEPLTEAERIFAGEHNNLIPVFLRRNRLPESDYFDVVVFGYLEAIQQLFRNPCDDSRKNFPALANVCMKSAVIDHWRYGSREKRRAVTVSFDSIQTSDDEELSLYDIIADPRQNVTSIVENRDLWERVHTRGLYRELRAFDLVAAGYSVTETAECLNVSKRKCRSLLRSIRKKTTTSKAEFVKA